MLLFKNCCKVFFTEVTIHLGFHSIFSFSMFSCSIKHLVKPYLHTIYKILGLKVRKSRNDFFKLTFLPKKRANKFKFTTMIPQVDLFSFIFWKKLKTPKKTFRN